MPCFIGYLTGIKNKRAADAGEKTHDAGEKNRFHNHKLKICVQNFIICGHALLMCSLSLVTSLPSCALVLVKLWPKRRSKLVHGHDLTKRTNLWEWILKFVLGYLVFPPTCLYSDESVNKNIKQTQFISSLVKINVPNTC